jgi:hypothetical protein
MLTPPQRFVGKGLVKIVASSWPRIKRVCVVLMCLCLSLKLSDYILFLHIHSFPSWMADFNRYKVLIPEIPSHGDHIDIN